MKTLVLSLLIILGFPAVFGLSRFLEANQTILPPEMMEADLTFRGETLKKTALGFDGLIADYYWMSMLQYVGNKIVNYQGDIQLDDLRALNPRLLYPMLDTATTLDPDFSAAYAFGSTVLPAVDPEQAIKITQKGIAAQPENWQMYHSLGFIYWRAGKYKEAAETYAEGARKPDAPIWMQQMSARVQAEGGSRQMAREIYTQMFESAQDEQTRELAAKRLLQVESFDERDSIRIQLQSFQEKNNRCPSSWQEIFPLLRTSKLPSGRNLRFAADNSPLDPSNAPYLLVQTNGKCEVELNFQTSKVPFR